MNFKYTLAQAIHNALVSEGGTTTAHVVATHHQPSVDGSLGGGPMEEFPFLLPYAFLSQNELA